MRRAFLRHVLHLASEGLKDGRSDRLIRDEIQADLSQRFDTAESELLGVVLRHLGLTRTLAGTIETAFEPDGLASLADRQVARAARQADRGQGRPADRRGARDLRPACATPTRCCR